jgi:hypothetical protein
VLEVTEYSPPTNDTCATAQAVSLTAGAVTIKGATIAATNAVDLTSSDCTTQTTSGPDVFFSVNLVGGKTYRVELSGLTSGFNAAVYLFTSCGDVAGTCGAGMGADSSTSSKEVIDFTPPSTGNYLIGVDGRESDDLGQFELTIKEKVVPANDACAAAEQMTLTGGKASTTGDVTYASNSIQLTNSSCTGWSSPGLDLFYKVSLLAGKTYTVSLTPISSYDPMLYVFTDCANAEGTCVGGIDTIGSGTVEQVVVSPTANTTYLIGVSAWSASEMGTFTLEVTETAAP